jgi:hypothetical protein
VGVEGMLCSGWVCSAATNFKLQLLKYCIGTQPSLTILITDSRAGSVLPYAHAISLTVYVTTGSKDVCISRSLTLADGL